MSSISGSSSYRFAGWPIEGTSGRNGSDTWSAPFIPAYGWYQPTKFLPEK